MSATAAKSNSDSFGISPRSSHVRSRVTNGSSRLRGVDGRGADARRFKDLIEAFERDLGGRSKLTQAEVSLVRQAAANVVASEKLQSALMRGEEVNLVSMTRLANITARCLKQLGIKRQQDRPASLAELMKGAA